MNLDPVAVCEAYRLRQGLRGKIPREGPHTEAGACQIDRVRTVEYGHIQLFQIPGRGE